MTMKFSNLTQQLPSLGTLRISTISRVIFTLIYRLYNYQPKATEKAEEHDEYHQPQQHFETKQSYNFRLSKANKMLQSRIRRSEFNHVEEKKNTKNAIREYLNPRPKLKQFSDQLDIDKLYDGPKSRTEKKQRQETQLSFGFH